MEKFKTNIPEPGVPYIDTIKGVKWQFIDLGESQPCTLCELNLENFNNEQTKIEDKREV